MGPGGMIYIPTLMKIGAGVEGISKFCLGNMRDVNVGISDVREL
jgi:hypothetical protein